MRNDRVRMLGSGGDRAVEGPRKTLFVRELRQEAEITVPDPSYEPTQEELNRKVFLPATGDTLEERMDGLARVLFMPVRIKFCRREKGVPDGTRGTKDSARASSNRRDLKKLANGRVRAGRRRTTNANRWQRR